MCENEILRGLPVKFRTFWDLFLFKWWSFKRLTSFTTTSGQCDSPTDSCQLQVTGFCWNQESIDHFDSYWLPITDWRRKEALQKVLADINPRFASSRVQSSQIKPNTTLWTTPLQFAGTLYWSIAYNHYIGHLVKNTTSASLPIRTSYKPVFIQTGLSIF